jgi:hypothetical protein
MCHVIHLVLDEFDHDDEAECHDGDTQDAIVGSLIIARLFQQSQSFTDGSIGMMQRGRRHCSLLFLLLLFDDAGC